MKFSKAQLYKLKKALLKLSEIQTEEGVTLITDGDGELTVGTEVFIDGEEGLVVASDGTYNYNGQIITVEGGVVTNIAEKQVETNVEEPEPETDPQPETDPETDPQTDPEPETDPQPETDPETDPQPETDPETDPEPEPAEDVEALKTRIAELEALVEELKKKLEEPVAASIEEEMKKQDKNENKQSMNYMAAIKKAREIQINRK